MTSCEYVQSENSGLFIISLAYLAILQSRNLTG